MNRASTVLNHLGSSVSMPPKRDDDVVIVSALRTPIGKAKRGIFKDTYVEDLLAAVLKATLDRTGINKVDIGDIVVGTVLGPGSQRANECRIAQFLAGIPETVPLQTVNRQCSSGLQAVATVASSIKAGYYEMGLACGVESMSSAEFKWQGSMNPKVFLNQQAKDCLLPMGVTSENVARQWKISRQQQDEMALQSNLKAAEAQKNGWFKDEIVPVATKIRDLKTNEVKDIIATEDDGVRAETTLESLLKLKPAFDPKGSSTAGNSSQVSDGAGCVVVCSRAYAMRNKLPIMAKFVSFAVAGVPPAIMGVGPAYAIPKALSAAGLTINDIDIFEINEAFASQALMTVNHLKIPINKVNPKGGAIALGHPLGATGARMTATLLHELKRRGQKRGIVSMCIGSGMGAAAVFEMEE